MLHLRWKAQLAQKMKKFEIARKAYATAADILVVSIESKPNQQRNELEKLLNSTLLAEISMAETEINTSPTKIQSYDHYLKINFNGPENNKVRYQTAKLFYDTNQLVHAIELFDQIVHDSNFKNKDLKLKSANLALDSLVILKNIKDLEIKALEYSLLFLDQAPQFHQISRNAGLRIVNEIASQNQTVNTSEKAFEKFETVTQKSMTREELKNHLKLKIDLSLKAQKLIIAQKALSQFITLRELSMTERRWALLKKLAIAELLLDFKQAYELVLILNFPQSNQPSELLKGALLAELNKLNASSWLEKVIRSSKSTKQQVNLARGQLVRFAKFPWKALHQQAPFIGNQPNLISDLALECFSRDSNISEAQWALNLRGIKLTDSGITLQRILSIKEIQNFEKTLKKEKLNSRTDNLLASSLRMRIKIISEIKKSLRHAQRKQDWTLQVYSASVLKKENDRIGQEIELLPIPKKLNSQEKLAYSNELLIQAKPFRDASKELQLFLDFTWQDPAYINNLLNRIESQDQIRNVLMLELRSLASVAPAKTLKDIQDKLAEFKIRPTHKEISETQLKLRNEPFDISIQNQLFAMEKKIGNQSMAVFLQARSDSLKGGPL